MSDKSSIRAAALEVTPEDLLWSARKLADRFVEGAGSMSDMECGIVSGWIAARLQNLSIEEVASELQVTDSAAGLKAAAGLLLRFKGVAP